jgi:hypothetical protein
MALSEITHRKPNSKKQTKLTSTVVDVGVVIVADVIVVVIVVVVVVVAVVVVAVSFESNISTSSRDRSIAPANLRSLSSKFVWKLV